MGGTRPDAEGMGGSGSSPISFLGRRLPPWIALRVVVLPPGCRHPYDPEHWRGALVVIEYGSIELELRSDRRVYWPQGYIGMFYRLSLRSLYNGGDRTAVITGASRSKRAEADAAAGTDTSAASSWPLSHPVTSLDRRADPPDARA
jgi:hypothetical protein